ncbi:hypothetical protein HDU76_005003 [Blyttiomyces sp. JEL0837]|nr:hypothetical protein HDU76_005003 [Blyttiomyces sp. JEL0837]
MPTDSELEDQLQNVESDDKIPPSSPNLQHNTASSMNNPSIPNDTTFAKNPYYQQIQPLNPRVIHLPPIVRETRVIDIDDDQDPSPTPRITVTSLKGTTHNLASMSRNTFTPITYDQDDEPPIPTNTKTPILNYQSVLSLSWPLLAFSDSEMRDRYASMTFHRRIDHSKNIGLYFGLGLFCINLASIGNINSDDPQWRNSARTYEYGQATFSSLTQFFWVGAILCVCLSSDLPLWTYTLSGIWFLVGITIALKIGRGFTFAELVTPLTAYATGEVLCLIAVWRREKIRRLTFAYETTIEKSLSLPPDSLRSIDSIHTLKSFLFDLIPPTTTTIQYLLSTQPKPRSCVLLPKFKLPCCIGPLAFTPTSLESEYFTTIYPSLFRRQIVCIVIISLTSIYHAFADIITFCAPDLPAKSLALCSPEYGFTNFRDRVGFFGIMGGFAGCVSVVHFLWIVKGQSWKVGKWVVWTGDGGNGQANVGITWVVIHRWIFAIVFMMTGIFWG